MRGNYFKKVEECKKGIYDVPYDLAVPPFGFDYYHMTIKQAKDNYQWFISIIPSRMAYFRNRCAFDLKVSADSLDYSAESLIPIWKWFIKTARIEKTPKDELEKMIEGAKIFGESWINREHFSIATRYIMRDIGTYIGESFVWNYPQLRWSYYDKPKNYKNGRQPVISGFYFKSEMTEGPMVINPMDLVNGAGAEFFIGAPKETDIFDYYMDETVWIPGRAPKN